MEQPAPQPDRDAAVAQSEPLRLPCREEQADFPIVGARARRWGRFERDLSAWLASPEGRFAAWRAQDAVPPAAAPEAQPPR